MEMIVRTVILALLLPCTRMIAVFMVYLCLLCRATINNNRGDIRLLVKQTTEKGLPAAELEKMPKVKGKELVMGTECAVCLDVIEGEQPARVVPGCNHGFHVHCADTWLSKNSVCPVCRAKLQPSIPQDDNPC